MTCGHHTVVPCVRGVPAEAGPRRRGGRRGFSGFSRFSGFSLIELVIVVVIIGIIAAIAIPRMSRGTAAAGDSALSGNLSVLRNAVELFATEHGGKFPETIGTAGTDTIDKQLTMYTDDNGATAAAKD